MGVARRVDALVLDAFLAGVAYGRENPEFARDAGAHTILRAFYARLRRYFGDADDGEGERPDG